MSEIINRDPNSYFSRHINEIEKKYILKKWKDNPEKLIQYLDMKNKYWRSLRNQVPNTEFEKSFILNLYQNYGNHKDLVKEIVNLGADLIQQQNPILSKGLKVGNLLIEAGQSIGNMEGTERIELAKSIMGDSNAMNSIMRDLDNRPVWNQAIAEGVSYSDGKLKEAYYGVMVLDYEYFYGKTGLEIPTTAENILKELEPYDIMIYMIKFEAFLKTNVRESDAKKINKLEQDLKVVSTDLKSLQKSFKEFIDGELRKEKEQQDNFKENARLADYKGYGQLLGYVIGIENPKLGNAISQGTSALIEAYSSFKQIKIVENELSVGSIGYMTSGVGSFLTVVSIVQGLSASGEDQTAEMLMQGLSQINENINQLRDEIKEYFAETFEQLDHITTTLKTNATNVDEKLNYITNLINEFTKRELESDFQTLNNDIYSDYECLYSESTKQQVYETLNKLYAKALNYSSIEKFTRINESNSSLYDYLELFPRFTNDSFKWSPISYRPVLILNLINAVAGLDVDAYFNERHEDIILEEIGKYKYNPPNNLPLHEVPFTIPKDGKKPIGFFENSVTRYYNIKESKKPPYVAFELREPRINIFFISQRLKKLKGDFGLYYAKRELLNLKLNSFLKFPEGSNVEFKMFNPVLCSNATKNFSRALSNAYLTNKLPFDEISSIRYKNSIADKFSNLYGANLWFYSVVTTLNSTEILKYCIRSYLNSVTELHSFLFNSLNFKSNEITDENDKIAFHNLLNSRIFIESGINAINCFMPSLTQVGNNYDIYRLNYETKTRMFSDCIHKLKNIVIHQEILDFAGEKGTNTNDDHNQILTRTSIKNSLELGYNVSDDFFIKNFIKFEILDKRGAEIGKLDLGMSDSELGEFWKNIRLSYVSNIGRGSETYQICNIRPESDRISFHYGGDPYYLTLSMGIFQDDLFERLKLSLDNGSNIIESFVKNEGENLKMAITFPSTEVSSFSSLDTGQINQLIEDCRLQWNNLTTALLCKSNSRGDFTAYFDLLDNKPGILSLPVQFNDSLINNVTGSELEKLYLLKSVILGNSNNGNDNLGLKILDSKDIDDLNKISTLNLTNNAFNEINFLKDKVAESSTFRINITLIDAIYNGLTAISETPSIMPSITMLTEEAIIECEDTMNMIYSMNYDLLQ